MSELSDNVTNRYLEYIPVIVAILNNKIPGCCKVTQRAMAEVSFRFAEIMIAFQQKDWDKIIHIDLVLIYDKTLMTQMAARLQEKQSMIMEFEIKINDDENKIKFNIVNGEKTCTYYYASMTELYQQIFERISHRIGKFRVRIQEELRNVVRIFMLLNGMFVCFVVCVVFVIYVIIKFFCA